MAGADKLSDLDKQEIAQWCLSTGGTKTVQEFYASPLGIKLKGQGYASRSIGPTVGAANAKAKKALAAQASMSGSGTKHKNEDGISGALLMDGTSSFVIVSSFTKMSHRPLIFVLYRWRQEACSHGSSCEQHGFSYTR